MSLCDLQSLYRLCLSCYTHVAYQRVFHASQEYTYRQRTFAVVAGLIALFLRPAAIVLQGIAHTAMRYCSSGACFGYHCGFHTERSWTEMLCLLHHARLFWVSSSVETQC